MNLDTDYASFHEDQTSVACNPRRRLRVRHRYPASLIELVGHLRARMPARDIADTLDIPLSSVYRWAPISQAPSATIDDASCSGTDWKPLILRCKADGFDVPDAIAATLSLCPPKTAIQKSSFFRRTESTTHAETRAASRKSNLEAARSMIERDYFRDIDSSALAAATGLSRFRFIHAFTETYDISPHQYLLRVRIRAAKRLLATSRETIDVIAAATGFRSGGCLNRAFTRMEGHCISHFHRVIGGSP